MYSYYYIIFRRAAEKYVIWNWTKAPNVVLDKIKYTLFSNELLAPFDPNLLITTLCDAWKDAVGGSRLQINQCFIFRNMNDAEYDYPQLIKDLLAEIFMFKIS